ncbi:MAG: 3-methylcrotonyl-CoA carboxylase alpha subunit [Chloroflexota bacterium]|nr:3-methylcrotonyl-CoA carboxylase alpha subunit [Chloroflexota bacterium]
MDPRPELSPAAAARLLGTSPRTVQRWIAQGRFPARRVGGRWRVAYGALDAFKTAHERGETPEPPESSVVRGTRSEPIRALFVANRGEIAARIRRTTDRLGIRAIVPGVDGQPEVDLLDGPALVAAARSSGADAVHPGFGFLSENADFAALVVAAGLRWVGPPAEAIRAMGDKAAARRLAANLGIPVVPGYDGLDQSDEALGGAAVGIGVPLIVKPSAGGGGKGMRVVRDLAGLGEALAAARREARMAFGDDRLVLERYLEGPRHVEVQVLFDEHGHGVHLGERDCSLQRRHQKILEETPSPAIDRHLRARLGSEALRLAGAVGYVNAGTCEFLLDDGGEPYFLEMNTRLQVEHPVTELAIERDLVADQLRIAAGEPLGFDQVQADAALARGRHAIEVRLYAEDAEAGFLPAVGRVEALQWPADRDGTIRVDSGVAPGSVVDERFDPMLAKIAAVGPDRQTALTRLTEALDDTIVLGLITNLRFLRWLVRQPVTVEGQARIDSLSRIWPPAAGLGDVPDDAWSIAAGLLGATTEGHAADGGSGGRHARSTDDLGSWAGGWRLNARPRLRLILDGEVERTVDVPDGAVPARQAVLAADRTVHVDVDGRSLPFRVASAPDVDRAVRAAAAHQASGLGPVTAPMPGAVLTIHVVPGATVAVGDPLVTLEAMKMEHVVVAPGPGTVGAIDVGVSDQVRRGQTLIVLQ